MPTVVHTTMTPSVHGDPNTTGQAAPSHPFPHKNGFRGFVDHTKVSQ